MQHPTIQTLDEALGQAIALHQSGHLAEAEQRYLTILRHFPEHGETRHRLGALAVQAGEPAAGLSHFQAALQADPTVEQYWLSYLEALLSHRQPEIAAQVLARRRQSAPAPPPSYAALYNNLGNAFQGLNRLEEAATCYHQALELLPDHPAILCNLGALLQEQGAFREAEAHLRRALEKQPGDAEILNNLGNALQARERLKEAESLLQTALRIQPDYAEAHNNLGNLLMGTHRHAEAEASFRHALRCQPRSADVLFNLGCLLEERQRFPEAEATFRQAVEQDPEHGLALSQAVHCAQFNAHWRSLDADARAMDALLRRGVPLAPFPLLSLPSFDDGAVLRRANGLYVTWLFAPLLNAPPMVDPDHHPRRERLRIGYASADFRNHPVTQVMAPVLESHDRGRFIVYAYAYGPESDDAGRRRIVAGCDQFRDLTPLSDQAAARRIADDGIDLLIDLTGIMQHFRLEIAARRPAPILVNFGHPGSMGHPRLADYKISDGILSPPHMADQFSERLALMPDSAVLYDPRRPGATPPSRAEARLPESAFVFCCFNQTYKLTPECFDLWCHLLREVPESVLWLAQPNPVARSNLRERAALRGVEPVRLIFAPRVPMARHLGRLSLADLALDTFPCTSHTTGRDALWSGVPLLTRMGDTFVSRVAGSLLHNVGLPELITSTWEAYRGVALELARHPDRLSNLRERLRANRLTHPLFDTERFTRDLERLYERMWRDHAAGKREIIVLDDATHPE
ncbi:MAG: tetratricopeptide repeat protein [Magnetococcales bacterium]|nr:tetratricopeptide repeat protein [Magnetococcales bacterium]